MEYVFSRAKNEKGYDKEWRDMQVRLNGLIQANRMRRFNMKINSRLLVLFFLAVTLEMITCKSRSSFRVGTDWKK